MSELQTKWLAHYDPIHRGWTPRGIATGLCTTNGFFFPRVRGGYHLRRATGAIPSMDAAIVGAGAAGETTIREFPWVTRTPGAVYVYRLNAIGAGGVEEAGTDNLATVEFDAAGNWVGARPTGPANLRVRPLAGGRFELRWTYSEPNTAAAGEAIEFRVFSDGGTGTMDYVTAVATIAVRARRLHYRYATAAFPHGAKVKWAVRAYTAQTVHDGNTNAVFAWADAEGPPAVPAFVARRGQEGQG